MGLKDLLNKSNSTSQKNNELRCRLRDLLTLAAIDGEITDKESLFIFNLCRQDGIQVETISGNVMNAPDAYPNDFNLRGKHLTQMVALMMIDGECAESEIKYCKKIASKLGIEEQAISKLVAGIANGKNNLLNESERESAVISFLSNGGFEEFTKPQNNNEDTIRQKIRAGFDQNVKKMTTQSQYNDPLMLGLVVRSAIATFYQQMKNDSTLLSLCELYGLDYQSILKEECNYALHRYLKE
ncbi:hypothetical protein [Alistipes timonensis]|uniref:hypothetical protein n=1 Tax=Alistipes timonensis TaxID=1465754 RepID=UPI001C3E29F1|nr:hypothetical protein [Alistipes timonensis]